MYYFKHKALESFRNRLVHLYGDRADRCLERLNILLSRYDKPLNVPDYGGKKWSQEDIVLITYGNMVTRSGEPPLATLREFAREHLKGAVNTIHVLPFCPYSSDDGFSVIDYRSVDPELGSWADIDALADDFRLMADLVLNHVSKKSAWFQDYVSGVQPYTDYFIEVPPNTDLSAVVRPRNTPLLRRTATRDGVKYLWTTFSEDQIDLDFGNANVLFDFLDILLLYIENGARIIRLDAIAYLWKKIGTECIHLPETHEVVRLIRQVLDAVAPGTLLITETNVPHQENVSYFGRGDEAHLVYQFALPPLLLHALHYGNACHLREWAARCLRTPRGCTFLNFTASHDGIGVRPLEGIIPDGEINALCDMVRAKGGYVSTKNNADGSQSPYELNITYFDALKEECDAEKMNWARFLCSQILPLSLKGIPALYFNNLFGAENDTPQAAATGKPRAINRQKWEYENLTANLMDAGKKEGQIFTELTRILKLRSQCPALHPDCDQIVPDFGNAVFGILRQTKDRTNQLLALHNLTAHPAAVQVAKSETARFAQAESLNDLITGQNLMLMNGALRLEPYQCVWLV